MVKYLKKNILNYMWYAVRYEMYEDVYLVSKSKIDIVENLIQAHLYVQTVRKADHVNKYQPSHSKINYCTSAANFVPFFFKRLQLGEHLVSSKHRTVCLNH